MKLRVSLESIRHNAETLNERYDQDIVAVLKGVNSDRAIAEVIVDAGIDTICDSDVQSLRFCADHVNCDSMLIRPPSPTGLEDVTMIDTVIHSDWEALNRIDVMGDLFGYCPGVYLMVDAGYVREGIKIEELEDYVVKVDESEHMELAGVATNPGCHTGEVDMDKLNELFDECDDLGVGRISGGSTALLQYDIPDEVDELRIGEALLTGHHAVEAEMVDGLLNPFKVEATVIKDKEDTVIYDFGTSNTNPDSMYNGRDILNSWSDMSLVMNRNAEYGDRSTWDVSYWGVERAFNGKNVTVMYD